MRIAAGATAAYATDAMVIDGTLYRWAGNTNELYTAVGDDTTADLAASGTPYMWMGNNTMRTADGDDTTADPQVTGISIAKGATLTLGNNYTTYANLNLKNDLVNHGTLTTADASVTSRGGLSLYPSTLLNDGTIDTSGSGTVANGGNLYVWADYSVINSGAISSNGADNAAGNGGNAGNIDLESSYYAENTGALNASGGNGTAGNGGSASSVYLYSEYGAVFNSGDIDTTGGTGDVGGDGGYVEIYNYYSGDLRNSGDINTSGGTGSTGDGGSAGDIDFYGYGGKIASSGNITAMGGGAAADSNAGSGGDVYLYNSNGYASWGNGTTPQEGVDVSGNIDLSGGNSSGTGNGGVGGSFEIEVDNYASGSEYTVADQAINLLGYSSIDSTGGDGQFPGVGGNTYLYADYGWDDALYTYGITGPVTNGADIDVSAGTYTGSVATGAVYADGGSVYFETSYYYGGINPDTKVTNSGNITSNGSGGMNATSNSYLAAGGIWMWGYNGVTNSGTMTLNGGNDTATDGGTAGRGGNSGWVELYAELGPVMNSAAITANGGDGEYQAGYGSNWTAFYGPSVRNTGSITGIGGDADSTLANYYPGYGGWVWMMGTEGPSSVSNSGTITLTPGTGYTTVNPTESGYYKVIGAHCEGDC
jgi:hypothetical protein